MKSISDINAIREKEQSEFLSRGTKDAKEIRVMVGMATCGISAGAKPVYETLVKEINALKLGNVKISGTGCLGMCKLEPIVEVFDAKNGKVTYVHVDSEKAKKIVANHIVNGNICEEYLITEE